jgi:tetratricopeptide (TPR) repeat protein
VVRASADHKTRPPLLATTLAATLALVALTGTAWAAAPTPGMDGRPVAPMSAQAATAYAESELLMREMGDHVGDRLMNLLLPLARKEPHSLLVGRLVVAAARIAHGPKGPGRVDGLVADADAAPNDALANFIAGVAAHYRGHGHGQSRQAKSADYNLTIKHLRRAEKDLGHAPRLWIYLAVSYYRTGRQAQAEEAIERAEEAEKGEDADVYYCSAEVYHGKDPAKALAEIGKYRAIMDDNRKKGAYTAPHKEAAVVRMQKHLRNVIAGTEAPQGLELFDPVVAKPTLPRGVVVWLLAAMLLIGPGLLVVLLKRHGAGQR